MKIFNSKYFSFLKIILGSVIKFLLLKAHDTSGQKSNNSTTQL